MGGAAELLARVSSACLVKFLYICQASALLSLCIAPVRRYLDPCRPRLYDMLTEVELEVYREYEPR
jgi:hypothetical protein